MSMLAERRQKTKYIIHPNKKPLWKTDEEGTKFGKQLMEKMGWSAGKGLGVNEQGISEPIRIGYKNDTKGMGFKENDNNWIQNQEEFDSLLSSLESVTTGRTITNEAGSSERKQVESLEEKSKKSKVRVHYQKFTRGKDLVRYSKDDLASILGNRKRKKDSEEKPEKDVESEENTAEKESTFGVTTVNGGSLADYFKRKWKNLEKTTREPPSSEMSEPSLDKIERKSNKRMKKVSDENEGAEPSEIPVETETGEPEENLSRFAEDKKSENRKIAGGEWENEMNEKELRGKKKRTKSKEKIDAETEDCRLSVEPPDEIEVKRKTKRKKTGFSETPVAEQDSCKEKFENSDEFVSPVSEKSKKKEKRRKKEEAQKSDRLQNPREPEKKEDRPNAENENENVKDIYSNEKIKCTKKFSRSKILNLVCDVRLDKFKGSNLERVSGYGAPKPKR